MPKLKLKTLNRLFRSNVLWERDEPREVTAAEAAILLKDGRWEEVNDEADVKLEDVPVEAVGAPVQDVTIPKKPTKITIKKGKGHPETELGAEPLDTGADRTSADLVEV